MSEAVIGTMGYERPWSHWEELMGTLEGMPKQRTFQLRRAATIGGWMAQEANKWRDLNLIVTRMLQPANKEGELFNAIVLRCQVCLGDDDSIGEAYRTLNEFAATPDGVWMTELRNRLITGKMPPLRPFDENWVRGMIDAPETTKFFVSGQVWNDMLRNTVLQGRGTKWTDFFEPTMRHEQLILGELGRMNGSLVLTDAFRSPLAQLFDSPASKIVRVAQRGPGALSEGQAPDFQMVRVDLLDSPSVVRCGPIELVGIDFDGPHTKLMFRQEVGMSLNPDSHKLYGLA
jgi:hypothetical protein